MSKVGRAAYSASRARLEVVNADKTISKNESGELYVLYQTGEGPLTITLPSDAEEGTRYNFWITNEPEGDDIILSSPSPSDFHGAVTFVEMVGAGPALAPVQVIATSGDNTLTIQSDTDPGSWIDCVYSTQNSATGEWFICGFVSADTTPAFTTV